MQTSNKRKDRVEYRKIISFFIKKILRNSKNIFTSFLGYIIHNFFSLRKIFALGFILLLPITFSACRTKCVEGSAAYPDCLPPEEREEFVEPEAPEEEKVEIVVWNLFDPKSAFSGPIQAFESNNRNISIRYKMFENQEIYERTLINEIAEGGGPDIFVMHHSWLEKHKKKISPMPENIMVPDKFRETFQPVASDTLILKDDDDFEQIYGIPLFIDTLALYYNKEAFRKISDSSKPDLTWEDIKLQVNILTEENKSPQRFALSGIAMGRADNIQYAPDIFSLLLVQEEAQLFDEEGDISIINQRQGSIPGSGEAFYPGQEALDLYTSFGLSTHRNYSWNSMITGYSPQQKELGVFVRGQTAMIFGYSTTYQDIIAILEGVRKNNTDTIDEEDIGVVKAPQFTKEGNLALAEFYPLTVSRNSENPDAAWEFLAYLASTESAREYNERTNKPTARYDLIKEQMTKKTFGIFAQQVPNSKVLPTLEQKDYELIVSEAINTVAKGKEGVRNAMKLVEIRLTCLRKKFNGEIVDKNCTEIESLD